MTTPDVLERFLLMWLDTQMRRSTPYQHERLIWHGPRAGVNEMGLTDRGDEHGYIYELAKTWAGCARSADCAHGPAPIIPERMKPQLVGTATCLCLPMRSPHGSGFSVLDDLQEKRWLQPTARRFWVRQQSRRSCDYAAQSICSDPEIPMAI